MFPLRPDDEVVAALIDSLERLAHDHIRSAEIDATHTVGPELRHALAELGAFGLSIPVEYGGFGFTLRQICSVIAALARHDRSVATTVGLHLGLGTRGLVAFGSHELKAAELPTLAAGARIAAFATTEPEAGSDLSAVRTRAVAAGDGLRVDGSKIYVTNGGFADVFTITASSPDLGGRRRGHSLVLLHRDDEGVVVGPEEVKLGLRGSSTTSLHLDNVALPMDRVIGTAGEGMNHLGHVLLVGRTVMAAGCVGTALAAEAAALRHVATRRQFGKTLGEMDVVRAQLADMRCLIVAAAALVARVDEDVPEGERLARSLAAKVFASEAAWEVADLAVQLHGGAGFIEETGVSLLLRDARIPRIFEGANDVLRIHLGMMEAGGRTSPQSPLGDEIDILRKELARRLGVRIASRPRLIHRLGSLAILRDSLDALTAVDPALGAWYADRVWGKARGLLDVNERPIPEVSP